MKTLPVIQAFINNRRAQNLSPQTVDWYSQRLKHFNAAYPILPTTPEEIESFLSGLVRSKRSDETVHCCFTVLRAFYRWAAVRYNVPDPMATLRAPRVTRKVRPTLEPREVWHLISLATTPRDLAILCLLVDTGIRAGELCSLRKRDIKESTIQVTGKSGQREVPISDDTRGQLLDLADDIRADDQIFRGRKGPLKRNKIYDIVHKYMTAAGITGPKLGPHRLRHAFGKGYLVAGGDLRSLQQIMGHASVTTTQQYTALTQGDIVAKHHQFTLLRTAQDTAQEKSPVSARVLKEAEEILRQTGRSAA